MHFVPDETVDAVLPGEGRPDVVLMAPDALARVGGDADIQGSVAFAGEDVNAGGKCGGHGGMVVRVEYGDRALGMVGRSGGWGALGLSMVLGPGRGRRDDEEGWGVLGSG